MTHAPTVERNNIVRVLRPVAVVRSVQHMVILAPIPTANIILRVSVVARTNIHPITDDCECAAVVNALCTITTFGQYHDGQSIALHHHQFDALSGAWVRTNSRPQSYINLTVKVVAEDYDATSLIIDAKIKTTVISAMTGTISQSCLVGIRVIHRLDIRQSDPIPVTMTMHTANSNNIKLSNTPHFWKG